jgi:hypothetical protein
METYDITTVILVASGGFQINQLQQEMQVGGNALRLTGKVRQNAILESIRVGVTLSLVTDVIRRSLEKGEFEEFGETLRERRRTIRSHHRLLRQSIRGAVECFNGWNGNSAYGRDCRRHMLPGARFLCLSARVRRER